MSVGMSDANNNMISIGIRSSENDSTVDSITFENNCLRGVSQKFQNSLHIEDMNRSADSLARPHSSSNPLIHMSQDRQLSDGWNSSNGWTANRWDHNKGLDPSDGWTDTSPDSNGRPRMRAIRKNSDPSLVYTTPPIGTQTGSAKDWYNTFVEQTHRFAQMNDRTSKHSNGKHVHFQDDDWKPQPRDPFEDTDSRLFSMIDNQSEDNDKQWMSLDSPTIGTKNSIVETLCDQILKPVANNFHHNSQYMAQQWNQNMSHIKTTLNNSTIFGDSIWGNASNQNSSINNIFGAQEDCKSHLHKLLASVRKITPKNVAANYTWSGQMPRRIRTKTPVYSCKVFLGGIPYDLTDSDLHCTFAQFGHISIQWPGKEIKSAIDGATANKAGYVYIIFENYDNVAALLSSCTISYRDMDSGCRWYYSISSRRQKSKEVQVIPFDIGDRFFMKSSFSGQMDHSRTVFVGALHGMLAADGLAKVMDDLFGGVIYAGLDTDKYKYPLGSGRVTFDNQDSYSKAVSAAFVEVKSARFKKKIQIDPYIENEQSCVVCRTAIQNPIYCREEGIYFCPKCWECNHSDPETANHRAIVKNKSSKA